MLTDLDILPTEDPGFLELVARHQRPNLPAAELEAQVRAQIERLVIPQEWYDQILAYYLSDEGIGEFIVKKLNLFLQMDRAMEQHRQGWIDNAALGEERDRILAGLNGLRPMIRPEAREIVPLLSDLPTLWPQLLPLEQRVILRSVFAGLYFDGQGKLRETRPHAPFVPSLGLEIR